MRVALYGGSFDPPHVGHVLAATYALSVGPFDRVLVVPVCAHPFAKALAPHHHRLQMCRLAFEHIRGVDVSDVEARLPHPNRTLDTVEHLLAMDPALELRLMIGTDVLEESGQWHGFERLEEIAPPWVLGRAGVHTDGAPTSVLPEVSSTKVRKLFAAGDEDGLAPLVPRAVRRYVEEVGLYRVA
jgi:nicotinate-nucleotide adenylyltransferase